MCIGQLSGSARRACPMPPHGVGAGQNAVHGQHECGDRRRRRPGWWWKKAWSTAPPSAARCGSWACRRARRCPTTTWSRKRCASTSQLFCADTQPAELAALRRLALTWMERLPQFRPHLAGAVWHGTATRLSDIYLQLFCDDPKSAEIALIDHGVDYEARTVTGFQGEPVEALSLSARLAANWAKRSACTCWSMTWTTCAAR